jgi:hypothetical protein
MTKLPKPFVQLSMAMIVGAAAMIWSGQLPLDRSAAFVSSAEARIGRPLTPMSYAGVARRTTRRAVVGGAAVAAGAAAAGAYYATPACTQVADAYGRVTTVCR